MHFTEYHLVTVLLVVRDLPANCLKMSYWLFMADFILYFHVLYVLGVILPIPLIAIGAFRKWHWIRNLTFRRVHAFMILIVVAESAIGMTCPLTDWEEALRSANGEGSQYPRGFISTWVSQLL